VALDIAARITTGRLFPGQTQPDVPVPPDPDYPPEKPGSVLLITPQEDWLDNIRPRLEAAQANVEKFISTTELQLEQLKDRMDRIDDLKLIIIDPLSFLIANDKETLSPVQKLFELYQHGYGHDVSILVLVPMRPGRGDPLHRIPGIDELAPFASIIFVASPDHREENTQIRRRVLIQLKNNLSPLTSALTFNIEKSAVVWSPDHLLEQNVDAILTPPRSGMGPDPVLFDRCVQWLYEFLAPKPRAQAEVVEASAAAGFSYRTLRRAKEELKVQSKREKEGHWIWRVHPGALDYDNFDKMTEEILRVQLPGLDEMYKAAVPQ